MGKQGIWGCENNDFVLNDGLRKCLADIIVSACGRDVDNLNLDECNWVYTNRSRVDNFIKANEQAIDAENQQHYFMSNQPGEKFFNSTFGYGTFGNANFQTTHSTDGVKRYICNTLIKFCDTDLNIINSDSSYELAGRFMNDPGKYALAADFDKCLKEQGIQFPPEMDKLYQNMKGMLDSLGQCKVAFDMARNPINLVVPERKGLGKSILESQAYIVEKIKENKELAEALGDLDIEQMVKEAGESLIKTEVYKENLRTKNELMRGKDTNGFFKNYTFQVNGKDATYEEAMKAKQARQKVTTRELSDNEKRAIHEAMKPQNLRHTDPEKAIACGEAKENKIKTAENYSKYFAKFAEITGKLNKTNSVFSKDSKEYKNVSAKLNKLTKDYKAIQASIKKNGLEANYDKLKDLYEKTQLTTTIAIPTMAKKYIEVREAKNQEKVSERGVARINVLKELEGIEPFKTGIDYIKQEPKLDKAKMDRARIDKELQGQNKKFERIQEITKDISKDLEWMSSLDK